MTLWRLALAPLVCSAVRMCDSPGGPHPCDCLFELESGSRIDEVSEENGGRHALINHPNGSITRLPECPYERPPAPARSGVRDPANICGLGFVHAAPMEAFYQHTKDIQSYAATYTVPNTPAKLAINSKLYYWIGLQDLGSSSNPVIQPVLTYKMDLQGNGTWFFESWNCCPAGHKFQAPTVPIEGPGATLHGSMMKTDDGLYKVAGTNQAGDSSVLMSNDTLSGIVSEWNWVSIVLEAYNVDSCSMYSDGGKMQFLDMTLVDTDGQALTPTWTRNDYINGQYLSTNGTLEFQACCGGTFALDWPAVTIEQNPSGMFHSMV